MKYDIIFDALGFVTCSIFINRSGNLIHIGYLDGRTQSISFNIGMTNIPTKQEIWAEYKKQVELQSELRRVKIVFE